MKADHGTKVVGGTGAQAGQTGNAARRRALLIVGAVIAMASLLIGLTTAQRAQSAAGRVMVERAADPKSNKTFSLSSLDTDTDCTSGSGYSLGSVLDASGVPTYASEFNLLEVHTKPQGSNKMPNYIVFKRDVKASGSSCPYNLILGANKAYFYYGNQNGNSMPIPDKLKLVIASNIPIGIKSGAKIQAGKPVSFTIPSLDTSTYKIKWTVEGSTKRNAKTLYTHNFTKSGKQTVAVTVTGPGGTEVTGLTDVNVGAAKADSSNNSNSGGSSSGGNIGDAAGDGAGVGPGTTPSTNPYTPPTYNPNPLPEPDYSYVDPYPPETEEPLPEPPPVDEETYETFVDPNLQTISGIPIASNGAFVPSSGGESSPLLIDDTTPLPTALDSPFLIEDEAGTSIPGIAWFSLAAILLLGLGAALELGKLRFGWLRETWLNFRYKLGV